MNLLSTIEHEIADTCFQQGIRDLLYAMCAVDTSPHPDVGIMRDNENRVFSIIKTYLNDLQNLKGEIEKKYIDPSIEHHPAFSKLHFTKTWENPDGLPPAEVYRERYNLLYRTVHAPSERGNSTAVNAHIDVVAPFLPPRVEGDYLYGRGAVDDKGNVAVILGALTIIDKLTAGKQIDLKNTITAMFVIEEETGGNGSLALAADKQLKQWYDSILILDTAENNIYPANRGAVWFKGDLTRTTPLSDSEFTSQTPSLPEAMAFAVLAMQEEGARIKDESDHPLFPHRPVQTCNGILGPFGEHPSRICGETAFILKGTTSSQTREKVQEALDEGIADFIAAHGDKTKAVDPMTNKKKVHRHYELSQERDRITIRVYGSTGHMGSILENDDAILKWAYITKKIADRKKRGELDVMMELGTNASINALVLEGGQGFLPTHPIEQIQKRMADAFSKGVAEYLSFIDADINAVEPTVSYDKLHNDAFDGDPDSPSMRRARISGIEAGIIDEKTPVRGWDVSCDARLFAKEYPGMPVITSGVGNLSSAHSDNEYVYLPDLYKSIVFTTLFLLRETGSA